MGVSEGGPLCSLFATTYHRTLGLVMIGTYARRLWAADYPRGPTRAGHERFIEEIRTGWGGPVGIEVRAPSRARDPAFRDWWSTYLRMGASPGQRDAHPDERRDRRPARAARGPRADAGAAPHRRPVPARSRKAASSPPRFPAPPWWSCPGTITCRLSATRTRCSPPSSPFYGSDARGGGRPGAGDDPLRALRSAHGGPARPRDVQRTPAVRPSGSAAGGAATARTACLPPSTARRGRFAAPPRWRRRRPVTA